MVGNEVVEQMSRTGNIPGIICDNQGKPIEEGIFGGMNIQLFQDAVGWMELSSDKTNITFQKATKMKHPKITKHSLNGIKPLKR